MRKILILALLIVMIGVQGCTTPGCPPDESIQCFFGFGYGDDVPGATGAGDLP